MVDLNEQPTLAVGLNSSNLNSNLSSISSIQNPNSSLLTTLSSAITTRMPSTVASVVRNLTFTNFPSNSNSTNLSDHDSDHHFELTTSSLSPSTPSTVASILLTGGKATEATSISDHDHVHDDSTDDILFILIPILLIITLAFFSGFALMCMQRRQKLDRLRHRLIPIYTFTHDEDDEWGVLIDNDRNAIARSQENAEQQQQQQQQLKSPRKSPRFGRK